MEEGIPRKPYEISTQFVAHRKEVYDYTCDTFGYLQAERYLHKINNAVLTLPTRYLSYPECRHISTKNRIYRNIIIDAHLIIYRITPKCIEVLDIIHGAMSLAKIRNVRKINL